MLKKFLKAALTACIVAGMSTAAMAYVPVGDSGLLLQLDTSSSYGQYNTGVPDETAYFASESETNITFLGMKGPWTVWADMEFDSNEEMKAPSNPDPNKGYKDMDAVGSFISYKVTPEFTVKLGTIHHLNGLQYALGSGGFSIKANHEGWNHSGWTESNGIEFGFQATPDLGVKAQLYSSGAAAMTGQFEGSATGLEVGGKVAGLPFKFGYLTEKYDDWSNPDDEGQSNTFTNLGVKVPLGDAMSISVDYSTSAISWNIVDYTETTTSLALQLRMGGIGPGGIIVTYGQEGKTDSTASDAGDTSLTNIAAIFEVKKGPGRIQVQYASSTAGTPNNDALDAVTRSWLGFAYDIKL